jgi:hypothetical protein
MKVDNAILSPASQASSKSEPTGQWFILCDALERPQSGGEPLASRHEIESLVIEAVAEHLQVAERPLSGTVLKEAIEEAHRRLRAACADEPAEPVASVVVVAEETNEEGKRHYLVAGAGDIRVYGVGSDSVELAFRDPVASSSKEKRIAARKNRLGVSDEVKVNHQQFTAGTYQSLLVLTYDAYIGVSDKDLQQLSGTGRHLPLLVKKVCPEGTLTSSRQAWLLSSHQPATSLWKRAPAVAALAGIVVVAIVGANTLLKEEPQPLAQKLAAPTAIETNAALPTLGQPIESEKTDELLTQIREESDPFVEREPVVDMLPPAASVKIASADYPDHLLEIELMLEAELSAQQQLLEQQKVEMGALRSEVEEHSRLRADFLALSDLLAEETTRVAELEALLEEQQTELISAVETVASQEQTIFEMQDQLVLARIEGEDLRTQQNDLFGDAQGLRIALSEREATFDELLEQAQALEQLAAEKDLQIAAEQARLEEVTLALTERERELGAYISQLRVTEAQTQEHFAAIGLLEDGNAALLDQVQLLSSLNQEQEQMIAAATQQQIELETAKEQLNRAAQEKQFLEGVIADLREIEQEQQNKVEEVMTARVELSDQLMDVSRNHEDVLLEKEQLLVKINELENIQQLYEKERGMREDKEEMLARLAANLDGWRSAVGSLEQSRASLAKELAEIRAYKEAVAEAWKETDKRAVAPPPPERKGITRIHLVSPGENLEAIALRYYGTAAGLEAIIEANRETLTETGAARVGTALVIP